jgi:hypothetical protein
MQERETLRLSLDEETKDMGGGPPLAQVIRHVPGPATRELAIQEVQHARGFVRTSWAQYEACGKGRKLRKLGGHSEITPDVPDLLAENITTRFEESDGGLRCGRLAWD